MVPAFFHSVTVTFLAVSQRGVALEKIRVDHAARAINFDTIVHAAVAGPTVFANAENIVFELDNCHRIIFAFGAALMQEGVHRGVDTDDLWIAAEHPAEPGEAVTTHIHEHAAAALVHVIEPIAVRAGMLFALLHHVDRADGVFIHELADALVLGCETKFLGIHEFHAGFVAGVDHFIGLFKGHRERFLDDDMLAGLGRAEDCAMMEVVRNADVHNVAIRLANGAFQVGERFGNVMFLREGLRSLWIARVNGDDFRIWNKTRVGFQVNVGNESGAEQRDFGFWHAGIDSEGGWIRHADFANAFWEDAK